MRKSLEYRRLHGTLLASAGEVPLCSANPVCIGYASSPCEEVPLRYGPTFLRLVWVFKHDDLQGASRGPPRCPKQSNSTTRTKHRWKSVHKSLSQSTWRSSSPEYISSTSTMRLNSCAKTISRSCTPLTLPFLFYGIVLAKCQTCRGLKCHLDQEHL